jgi:hypothetical protein
MIRLLIVTLLLIFAEVSCSEQISSHFKDYGDAVLSQSWIGNWIPRGFPTDAVEIFESHDLENNAVIMKYRVHRSIKRALDSTCKKIENSNAIDFAVIREKWWPAPLYGKAWGSSNEYWYYICQSGHYAVQFLDTTTAYYWRNK